MRSKIKILIILYFIFFNSCNLFGQWVYFGRNKVQYKNFNWQLMKTDHFDIYYYPEMEELAKIGANFAEKEYSRLETKFNHTVTRRIPLIFYSSRIHFQQTNILPMLIPEGVEGFIEYIKGRVTVPYNGSLNKFKTTISHELVHALQMSKTARVQKDHRITVKGSPPFWFSEGLADYWAGEWESMGEMVLRDMIVSNNFVSLKNINSITGSYLAYKEGQTLLKYISDRFGEEKIRLLMENFWKDNNFKKIIENTLDIKYEKLGRDWEYDLKKKYFPLFKDSDLPTYHAVRLTNKGFNRNPKYVKIGNEEKMLFLSNRSGYSNIYMKSVNKDLKEVEILVKGERSDEFEYFHLFEPNLNVNSQNELAFIVKSGERDVLYIMNINDKKIKDRFEFDDIISITSPNWSRNNLYILFSGLSVSGKKDIYSLDITKRSIKKLTDDFYEDKDAIWLSDGKSIIFSSDRGDNSGNGSFNLFIMNLETGSIKYMTHSNYNDYAPVIKKDENIIAYVSEKDDVPNIFGIKYEFTGETGEITFSEPLRFTNYITAAMDPDWTDKGDLIFTTFENFRFDIQKISNITSDSELGDLNMKSGKLWSNNWEPEKISNYKIDATSKYKKSYSLDVAQGQVMQDPFFGTSGGAQIALSDVLGDDKYYFLLYNNAQTSRDFFSSFNFSITRVYLAKRFNFAYGLYHFSGRRFYGGIFDNIFWERTYGASFSFSYPISKFKRITADFYFNRSDRDWVTYRRKALLLSNYISYVKDNSIWGLTGPVDGTRYNLSVGFTHDLKYNNVNYWTMMFDIRKYFRITNRITLATRLMTLLNQGKEAQRYYFGGSWDLRGYKRLSLAGEKLWLSSTELRFPLIDFLGISLPFMNFMFREIRGAAFLDFGNSWNDKYDETLGSFGYGIRLNVLGFLVLRYDTGKKFINKFRPVRDSKFHQFFFGWDF
ncbi:hypothetical protein ACFL4T_08460 [candidate division KSB1 bacterium]